MKKINQAFTLIELLVVIAIVGILSGFVIVSMSSAINAAKDAQIKSDIGTITKAILVYAANNNSYPSGDTYPCTIGGGTTRCTNLESNLAQYLTAIPRTPSNGFYTYSYSGTGPSFTLQSTLSTGSIYQYNSSSYFSTISYVSSCASATNTQVSCSAITVNATEEACKCIYLSGAGTTSWTVPNGVTSVQYLVVGGGGSGHFYGGGGGAGGLITGSSSVSYGNSVAVTVGVGGAWTGSQFVAGSNGGTSSFGANTAAGGGAAGPQNANGITGGSGGGAGSSNLSYSPGNGTQGNRGGYNYTSSPFSGGGGGGAGAVGGNATSGGGGAGGDGLQSSITGTSLYYAGGGGGAKQGGGVFGTGGQGGGGSNSVGVDEYGGGGSGSYKGGSGVVIFRYTHP
jgi:prepilin-type N-terminal cleavage/methylation domain-containing protein